MIRQSVRQRGTVLLYSSCCSRGEPKHQYADLATRVQNTIMPAARLEKYVVTEAKASTFGSKEPRNVDGAQAPVATAKKFRRRRRISSIKPGSMLQSFLREGHWNQVLGGPGSKENAPHRARLRPASAPPVSTPGRTKAGQRVIEDGVLKKPIENGKEENLGEDEERWSF